MRIMPDSIREKVNDFTYHLQDNYVIYGLILVGFIAAGLGVLKYLNDREFEINVAMQRSGAQTYSRLVTIVCDELKKHPQLADIAKLCDERDDLTNVQLQAYNDIKPVNFINNP